MLRNESLPPRDVLATARTVVAATDEDDRHPQARGLAVASARASGARVLLYDIGSASSLASPVPNEWAAEGEPELYGETLNVPELERLGRRRLATQIEEAAAQGVEVEAWLPRRPGMDAMLGYAERHDADVVLISDEEADRGLLDRLLGTSETDAERADRESPVPVLLVSADGSVRHAARREEADDR